MSLALPAIRRLLAEQVPSEDRGWVEETLVRPLNQFIGPVAALVDGGLSIGNLNAQVLSLREPISVPSDILTVSPVAGENPYYKNGWLQSGDGGIHKDDSGWVSINVVLGTGSAGSEAFTLPEAYWPSKAMEFATVANNAFAYVTVSAAGVVTPSTSNVDHHINIRYPAANRLPIVSSAWPRDFGSTLKSNCAAVLYMSARASDGTIHGPVSFPVWEQRTATDRKGSIIRIKNQPGLVPGKTYRILWLAIGE